MVWNCTFAGETRNLQFIDGIVNAIYQQILENALLPSMAKLYPNRHWIYQQESAPCHNVKVSKNDLGIITCVLSRQQSQFNVIRDNMA